MNIKKRIQRLERINLADDPAWAKIMLPEPIADMHEWSQRVRAEQAAHDRGEAYTATPMHAAKFRRRQHDGLPPGEPKAQWWHAECMH